MTPQQAAVAKKAAAEFAIAKFVQPGMRLGLGSGTTAAYAVRALAERISKENLVLGKIVSTSLDTAELAKSLGIEVFNELNASIFPIDLTIDGADDVDAHFNLIKGGGGALLREKLAAIASTHEVIVVDETKVSVELGHIFPLSIMIVPYGWELTKASVDKLIGRPSVVRKTTDETPFVSDDGLYCLDVEKGAIPDPARLEKQINRIVGVVEVGLFINLAQNVVVGYTDGTAREMIKR